MEGPISYEIELNGKKMKMDRKLLSIDVHAEVNRIPWAEICFLDGDMAKRKFIVSESGDVDLGTKVKISLSYTNAPATVATVFEGIVTRHSVEMGLRGQLLRVECRHAAFALTQQRKSAAYAKKTDAKVIDALATPYSSMVKVDTKGLAGVEHAELVQYFATDWDFMLSRCEANGWLVLPKGPDLKIISAPKTSGPVPKGRLMDFNATTMLAIEMSMDGTAQYDNATAQAWSFKDQALTSPSKAAGIKRNPGKIDPGKIKNLSSGIGQSLFNGTTMPPAELKAWSAAAIDRSRLSFMRGRFEIKGDSKIAPGLTCKINGVGTRFDGIAFITAVRHRFSLAGWTTDVQVGLPANSYSEGKAISDAPAAGLLPAVNGIQIGVVQKFKEDKPTGQFRVQVYMPAMGKKTNLIWARLAMPTAGKGKDGTRGMLFWPEEGDEVIVGFLNDDPRAAIILGSLFNSKNAPLYPPDAKNAKKGLVTKSGSKLEFDDEKQEIVLSTKEKLEIKLNEKEQVLTLKESGAGAVVKLDKKGIILVYKGNKLEITEDGVTIKGGASSIEVTKAGIKVDSKKKLTMKGAGAMLDGGPKVEIKGGMVELK
jgi:phage protein D